MKRFFALLTALALWGAGALAQAAPLAVYETPDGAQARYITEADFDIPQGMEPAYALMQNASLRGDIYLLRMQNGYGLASVSCRDVGRALSAQDLLDRWPQIAQALSGEAVLGEGAQALIDQRFDTEVLHIQAVLGAGDAASPLLLDAEAFAFSRGTELIEVWTLCPSSTGDTAIESDRADLAVFLESLSFPGDDTHVLQGLPYQDERGFFGMMIPPNSVVIAPSTGESDVQAARARYLQANAEGAEVFFDSWMEDIQTLHSTLILMPDMNGAVLITASEAGNFAGWSADRLLSIVPALTQSIAGRYEVALPLGAQAEEWVSGRRHALMGFWLREGETDMQLDILACATEEGWLYEADLFTLSGDQDLRAYLHTFVAQTLEYFPPENGLNH